MVRVRPAAATKRSGAVSRSVATGTENLSDIKEDAMRVEVNENNKQSV